MKGIIFDLDGTLIDSIGVWKKVDEKVLARHGVKIDSNFREEIKMMTYTQCIEYIIEKYKIKKTFTQMEEEFTDEAMYQYSNVIKAKKGAENFIYTMKKQGIKLSVATSCNKDMCEAVLKNNGLYDYFDAFAYCEEEGVDKNTSDIYIKAAEKMQLVPEKCIVFEDIAKAAENAAKAGMKVIGMADNENAKEAVFLEKICVDVVHNFDEVQEKIVKYL